eukprot:5264252-Pleurochrysis_carterae.AAC.2
MRACKRTILYVHGQRKCAWPEHHAKAVKSKAAHAYAPTSTWPFRACSRAGIAQMHRHKKNAAD